MNICLLCQRRIKCVGVFAFRKLVGYIVLLNSHLILVPSQYLCLGLAKRAVAGERGGGLRKGKSCTALPRCRCRNVVSKTAAYLISKYSLEIT